MAAKLYTKTGDDGTSGLLGGKREPKDSARFTAIGEVDELNSALGLAAVACSQAEIHAALLLVQQRLFELGADLGTPRPLPGEVDAALLPRIGPAHASEAEQLIDAACDGVPELRCFILPGGTELAARLHYARSVARRAERACVTLARLEPVGSDVVIYLNRVSDLLFALAESLVI